MIHEIQIGFFDRIKLWPESWASGTAYALGDVVKSTTYNSHSYLVTTAGTTTSTEPTWPTTDGATVSSGTVAFTCADSKTYNIIAPQSASVPYCTFGLLTEVPMGDFEDFEAVSNLTYWVNCFSNKDVSDVCEIADEVMSALDNTTISASGFTNMKTVREFTSQPIYDGETGIYQASLRYRVLMDKS